MTKDRADQDAREAAGLALLDRYGRDEAVLYARRARQLVDSSRLSEQLERSEGTPRFLVMDLAATLRVGQQAAQGQLEHAVRLVEDFPLLHAQLSVGAVLVPQARRVIDHTWTLSPQVAREVDRRLADRLWRDPAGWIGARLTRALTRVVLQTEAELEPAAAARRHTTARRGRRVSINPEPDGMGSLWALLPAEALVAFARGLDALTARQSLADRVTGTARTADQRRADVLAALPALALHALDGAAPLDPPGPPQPLDGAPCRHPRVVLEVQVPMATLLGHSDAPGHLTGYGPISAHQVRLLLPDAHLRQVLVDAATGEVLSTTDRLVPPAAPENPATSRRRRTDRATRRHAPAPPPPVRWLGGDEHQPDPERLARPAPTGGPASPDAPRPADRERLAQLVPVDVLVLADEPEDGYRPSAALQRLLRRRDELCTGPGCGADSRAADLDHARPWPHGPTNAQNMRPHSRRCHRAKTVSWTTRRTEDGTLLWTSPTSRTYPVPVLWQPAPTLQPQRSAPPAGPERWADRAPRSGDDDGLAARWTTTVAVPGPVPPQVADDPPF